VCSSRFADLSIYSRIIQQVVVEFLRMLGKTNRDKNIGVNLVGTGIPTGDL